MHRLLLFALLLLFACKEDPAMVDASLVDAGEASDAGSIDGNTDDAGSNDADPGDAGSNDADPSDADPNDADPGDADPNDAGLADADPNDAGADASIDAGPIDGGFLPTFTGRPIDDSFLHGQAVTLADIEGDGDLDVIGAISLDDTVRLYLNGGDGSSWNAVDVAQVGTIVAMHTAVADLDGDGDLDIAAVGLFDRDIGFASPGEVTWYRNPGNPAGTWAEVPITGLTYWGPRHIAAGDLTGDGIADLVVGSATALDENGGPQGDGVRWFRNTGGAFAAPVAIDANLANVGVVLIHDVDGDGVLDVIAAGAGSNEIVWYENQRAPGMVEANPGFTRHTIFSLEGVNGLALAQKDQDAALELFAAGDNGSGGLITWLDPPANPASPWISSPIATDFGAGNPIRLAAIDLNLDGRADVAVAGADSVRAYVDDGAGGWTLRIVQEPFAGADFVAAGDIDRDGIPDLVTSTYSHDENFDRFDWWRVRP